MQVDEALSEIHESIAELAILLQKDEIASQVVEATPQMRKKQSPASSTTSESHFLQPKDGELVGLQSADKSPQSRRLDSFGPDKQRSSLLLPTYDAASEGVKLPDPSIVSSDDVNGQQSMEACAFDKAHALGDLSYDLSMSYSVLGKSRMERDSGMCADNIDVTNLSMNLSQEDSDDASNQPLPDSNAGSEWRGGSDRRQSSFFFPSGKPDNPGILENLCALQNRHVMGDNLHAQPLSCENISVTVSDVSGSMHDTCELSKCETSKCSPSPHRGSKQIEPKGLDRLQGDLVLSPSTPARVGLGIKFKQSQAGAGFPVAAVVSGGPADCAGIEPGDVLMFVCCNTMTTVSSSRQVAISIAQGGSALHVILRRGSKMLAALVRRPRSALSAIGTAIAKDPSRNPHVCSVAAGSPAEEAGILAGDEVVAVGAQCVVRLQRDELLDLLVGEHGSLVVLGISRAATPGQLEWMALRRSGAAMSVMGAPVTPPLRCNAIVPKTVNPPPYAAQANQYAQETTNLVASDCCREESCFGVGVVGKCREARSIPATTGGGEKATVGYAPDRFAQAWQLRQQEGTGTNPPTPNSVFANGNEQQAKNVAAQGWFGGSSIFKTEIGDPDLHSAAREPQLAPHALAAGKNRQCGVVPTSQQLNDSLRGQHSVLESASPEQRSLPQAVVAVGGATVSIGPDLYKSSASSGVVQLPSSQQSIRARSTSPPLSDLGHWSRCGSSTPTDLDGGRSSSSVGQRQLGIVQLGRPVETLLSTRSAAPIGSQPMAARNGEPMGRASGEAVGARAPDICASVRVGESTSCIPWWLVWRFLRFPAAL